MKKIRMEIILSDDQYKAWKTSSIRMKTGLLLLSSMGSGAAPVSFSKKSMDEALKEEVRRAVWDHF